LLLRPAIVAIDGLSHGRGALHHVGRLGGHGGRSLTTHPHLRLRRHGLRAAGHGWVGAEDVGKGSFPRARGLAIAWAARKLWPLLVPVVGHVLFNPQACLPRREHPQAWGCVGVGVGVGVSGRGFDSVLRPCFRRRRIVVGVRSAVCGARVDDRV
jgi:hypothetical protein